MSAQVATELEEAGAAAATDADHTTWGHLEGDPVVEAGSITKGITGILLALALAAREVEADTRLSTLLPAVGRLGDATLGGLATHTAGVPRLPRGFVLQALRHVDNPYAGLGERGLRLLARLTPRNAPAGTYSNLGVALLGQALARAAGTDFWTLARQQVLGPLGMRRSGDVLVEFSTGRVWDLAAMAPAGGLHAPVSDLLLLAGALATPETTPLAAAIRDAVTLHAPQARGGVGWCWQNLDGTTWHNGGTGSAWAFVGARDGRALAAWVGGEPAATYDQVALRALLVGRRS